MAEIERLTERLSNGDCKTKCLSCPMHGKCQDSRDCVEVLSTRLADYEDSGLSPQQVAVKAFGSEWINVRDKLPDKLGMVCLCCCEHYEENSDGDEVFDEYSFCVEQWCGQRSRWRTFSNVEWWIPILEPPKEENQ